MSSSLLASVSSERLTLARIPIVSAAIVLIYLHQRNKKRQRIEDRRDEEKYKSLDFGTSLHFTDGKNKKKKGDLSGEGMSTRQMRGLSIEAGPYMFPDNVHDSRASLHSMSRSAAFDEFNPYRPADEMSIRAASPGPGMRGDNSSIGSSTLRRKEVPSNIGSTNTSHTNLLRHPQPPPKSLPPGQHLPFVQSPDSFEKPPVSGALDGELKEFNSKQSGLAPAPVAKNRDSYFDKNALSMRNSTNYLGKLLYSREPSAEDRSTPAKDNTMYSSDKSLKSNPESAGSTLVNTPSQTTPKASISDYDAPKIDVSEYNTMPRAFSPPGMMATEALPSAKTLPSAKSLPATPRPDRKQSAEKKQPSPPAPPKEVTPLNHQSPPQQQQSPQNQQNAYRPQRTSSNQAYAEPYSAQQRQSNDNHPSNYASNSVGNYMNDNGNYGEYNPYSQRESASSYGAQPTRGQSLTNQMPVVDEYSQEDQYPQQSQYQHDQYHNQGQYQQDQYQQDQYQGQYEDQYQDDQYQNQYQQDSYASQDQYLQPPGESQNWEQNMEYDDRRLSIFMRPLPPEDPSDTPEVRANRIRSFYKEYFDRGQLANNGRLQPGGPNQNAVPYPQLQRGEYYDYEDYGQEYMNAATVYDPQNGGFVVGNAPYAEPVTRRAMTPPPRGPPRFRGRNGPPSAPGSRPGSNMSWNMPPRGVSAMSFRGRQPQRKPRAPPTPLLSLPTPHLLNADSVLTALDFAPPASFRDRQAGRRPDSPLGTPRPYSPTVRAHVPLQSSFDDLAVIPSP